MSGKNLEAMAEGLVTETMAEAATTFFGARRALEHEIELYRQRRQELERLEHGVLRRAAALHSLLPAAAVPELYAALGVEPGRLGRAGELADPDRSGVRRRLAPTAGGRYARLVQEAYAALAEAVDVYIHGRHYDGEGGRKMQTPNFTRLCAWCGELNGRIKALNRNHSPSGTLGFFKGLDPSQVERSRLSEATLDNYAGSLDEQLAFKPLPCPEEEGAGLPELPPADVARKRIVDFARAVYEMDPERARGLYAAWKRAEVAA